MPDEPGYSEVFPPGSKPTTVEPAAFLAMMDDVKREVERGASMEGSILWGWSFKEPGKLDVGGMYRIGNDMGQGGVVVLWDTT